MTHAMNADVVLIRQAWLLATVLQVVATQGIQSAVEAKKLNIHTG